MSKLLRGSAPLLALIATGCVKDQDRAPFDPREFQQDERRTASEVKPRAKQPLPTTLQSPFITTTGPASTQPAPVPATGPAIGVEPTVRMTLREIVQRAVANSLDVKVEGYSPAIEETRVTEAEARFDPTFFTTAQNEKRNDPNGGSSSILGETGTIGAEFDVTTLRSGVRQVLPSGGELELRYQVQYNDSSDSTSAFQLPNEGRFWENELALQLTQPLLRDFGVAVNRARIDVARNNQRISLLDFRKQLETTVSELEQIYWQQVQAMWDVAIQEDLLNDTLATAELLFRRRTQDVTRVQISQANASVENRRALLIRARARVRDLSDELKRRMNDPELPITGALLILPANEPLQQPVHFTLEDQIATGLENRLELGQQQLRIDSTYIAARVAKQNLQPQLNLTGAVGVLGVDEIDGKFDTAFSEQMDFDNISFAIGLQFEIPIGNRAARAGYRRSRLQQEQAIVQYRALIDQVALDVKKALRETETTWEEMVATKQAVFANEDALLALRQREQANEPLTPDFVERKLNQQERLAEARRARAAAVSNYNNAIAALELAKGTLLRYNNVIMEEAEGQLARK
jgi:outer membrane protein TolC